LLRDTDVVVSVLLGGDWYDGVLELDAGVG
jgi:hypothetical protein